jgi:hypothetical protein
MAFEGLYFSQSNQKEDELKGLKIELNNLERQIKLSLKPIEQTEGQSSEIESNNQ